MRIEYILLLAGGILLVCGLTIASATELDTTQNINIISATHYDYIRVVGSVSDLQVVRTTNITGPVQRIISNGVTIFSVNPRAGGIFSTKKLVYPMSTTYPLGATWVKYTIGNKPKVSLYIRDGCWFNLRKAQVSCSLKTWGNV